MSRVNFNFGDTYLLFFGLKKENLSLLSKQKFSICSLYIFFFALLLGQNNSNYSLSFDGQTGYASIPDSPSLNFGSSSISYSLWLKKPASNHYLQTNLITDYRTPTNPSFGFMIEGERSPEDVGKIRIFYRTRLPAFLNCA